MSRMISVAEGFQYSVNIGYDLANDKKIKNFIPTSSSLSLLEDILSSTNPTSAERARVLIGAYGKGKSHIVLMILSMLMKKDIALFEKMMSKAADNPRLLQLINSYYESETKILPVVVTGSNTSLTQAFLLALQRTLSINDLMDIMPKTNYQAADRVIRRWAEEFPETYKKFEEMIGEGAEAFIDRLSNFDVSAYEKFEKCYRELTSGSQFNPFLGFDVVELYENVAEGIKAKGYSGLYVVYDEFSKYLEANITDATVSDTKMLQDFAEKCSRSGDLQMHLMLICHKEISNYIDKLPQQKVDGWRGVSERFKHVRLNNNFSQTYEIISSVINKDSKLWKKFLDNNKNEFQYIAQRYEKHPMFTGDGEELHSILEGCYPLHPVSTFILPRLSEKVAQNERTLFTFLSAPGKDTLLDYLSNSNEEIFNLLTPDLVYDYFEPLLMKEAYDSYTHNLYVLTRRILNNLDERTIKAKIVKTISLIYILEQFEKLKPTVEEIVGIYANSFTVEEIESAISELIEQELVVYLKRSNNFLRLKESSGVDIKKKIHDFVEHNMGRIAVKEVLNTTNYDCYMYPSRYNDEHEMTRFFSFEFIDSDEITGTVNWEKKSEYIKSDGIIYGIIPSKQCNIKKLISDLKESSSGFKRHIFIVPKKQSDIRETVMEYNAAFSLQEMSADDPQLFDEYEVVCEDLLSIIQKFISSYTHPENQEATFIADGKLLKVKRKAELTEAMSSVCDDLFSLTPVINNESVNKTELTSTAFSSRNKIINGLLRAELEHNLGLSGTGQDVSIMRSTLVRTGIWSEENGVPRINIHPDDARMSHMLSTIENFILGARHKGNACFSSLYNELTSPDFGIGIREGLIPIYLAAVIHEYRQQVVISDQRRQLSITADSLVQVNSNPNSYFLEFIDWDPEKEDYINVLSKAFSSTVIGAEKHGNSYDYVANAMKRWYMGLPKYSKECKNRPSGKKIGKRQLEMIRILRSDVTGAEMLFKRLPDAFDYHDEFTVDTADDIINTKELYDGLLDELKLALIQEVKAIFIKPQLADVVDRMSLSSIIREWCDNLEDDIFNQLFADGTEKFLSLSRDITNDEELYITQLAKNTTDLHLEDWDKKTIESFTEKIKLYKKTAEAYTGAKKSDESTTTTEYQISFMDNDGNSVIRRFDRTEVSPKGKLLSNQILASLDSMGYAISEQEKRQVIMEILKELC